MTEVELVPKEKLKESAEPTILSDDIRKTVLDADHGFQWVDICGTSSNYRQFLGQLALDFNLHKKIVKNSLASTHLPKIEKIEDGTIFIVTRYCDPKASNEMDTIQELTNKIVFYIRDKFIITIHREDLPSLTKIRDAWDTTFKTFSHEHLMNFLIDKVLDTFASAMTNSTEIMDIMESKICENQSGLLQQLYHLRRRASVFRRMLTLTKIIVVAYSSGTAGGIKKKPLAASGAQFGAFKQQLVDYADALHDRADIMHSSATGLLELHMALIGHQTSELVKLLASVSVFFTPLTFMCGIYGMNFDFLPELHFKYDYPILLVVMMIVVVSLFVFMRKKGYINWQGFVE